MTLRIPAINKIASTTDVGFPVPPERETTRMRQTLAKGLIVAAATSALSLYGTWSSAAPGIQGAAANSGAALSARTDPWDAGELEAHLDDRFGEMQERFHELHDRLGGLDQHEPDLDTDIFGHGDSGHDSEEPKGQGYGAEESKGHGYGPAESKDHGYGPEDSKGNGYGPEESKDHGYGREESKGNGYGPEESSGDGYGYGYGEEPEGYGYGSEEPDGYGYGYGDEETHSPEPTPSHTKPPSHKPTPTPAPTTPPGKPGRPQIPETGAEAVVGGIAASGALLIAGTVLYRRGRAASRR